MDAIENNELNISIHDLFSNKNTPLTMDVLKNFSTVEGYDSVRKRYLKEENIIKLIKEYLKIRDLKILESDINTNIIKLFPTVDYNYNLILIVKEKININDNKKIMEERANNNTIKTIISYGLFETILYIEEFVLNILNNSEEVV